MLKTRLKVRDFKVWDFKARDFKVLGFKTQGRKAESLKTQSLKVKKTTRAVALMLVVTTSLFSLSGCFGIIGSREVTMNPQLSVPVIIKDETLVVAVDSNRAPYARMINGELKGIDVDIAAALANQLGLKLELVDIATSGMTANELLLSGTVDMVMGIEPTSGSVSQAKVIGPYLLNGPALFMTVRGNTVPEIDLESLRGAKVVAQVGSLSAWTVDDVIGDGTVVTLANLLDVLAAVEDGSFTYAAADAVIGSYFAADDYTDLACVKLFPKSILGIYVAVPRTSTQLADALTDAMRGIRDDGVLMVILTKWFKPASASVLINPSTITSQDSNTISNIILPVVDLGLDLPDPSLAGGV